MISLNLLSKASVTHEKNNRGEEYNAGFSPQPRKIYGVQSSSRRSASTKQLDSTQQEEAGYSPSLLCLKPGMFSAADSFSNTQ